MTLTTHMTLCIKTGPVIVMKVGQPVTGLLHLMTGQRRFVRRRSIGGSVGRTSTHSLHFRLRLMPRLVSLELCLLRFVDFRSASLSKKTAVQVQTRGFRVQGFCGVGLWWRWVQGFEGVGVRV